MKDLLERNQLQLETMDKDAMSAFCRNIGHRAINAINRIAIITPHALVAASVLNHPAATYTFDDIAGVADTYLKHLHFHGNKLADTLIMDTRPRPEAGLRSLCPAQIHRAVVQKGRQRRRYSALPDECRQASEFRVLQKQLRGLFRTGRRLRRWPFFSATAFQFISTDLHISYRFLQDLFKYEFAYDIEQPPEFYVRKSIKAFIDDAVLMPHPTLPDTYNITSSGLRKLRLYAGFLKAYFEAYFVVLTQLSRQKSSDVGYKEQAKKVCRSGRPDAETQRNQLPGSIVTGHLQECPVFFQQSRDRVQ